jgi:hypothetical protein
MKDPAGFHEPTRSSLSDCPAAFAAGHFLRERARVRRDGAAAILFVAINCYMTGAKVAIDGAGRSPGSTARR